MGLDKAAIRTQDVTLDTAQSGDSLHLRVNGKTIDERQKEENAKSIEDHCKMVFRRKSTAFSAGTLQNAPDARN